jgi:hypothetical protein
VMKRRAPLRADGQVAAMQPVGDRSVGKSEAAEVLDNACTRRFAPIQMAESVYY